MSNIKKKRLEELLCRAIEDIRETWSDGYGSVIVSTGITKEELKDLGYDINYSDFTAEEALGDFPKFIDFCNHLKEAYWEAMAVSEYSSEYEEIETADEIAKEQAYNFMLNMDRAPAHGKEAEVNLTVMLEKANKLLSDLNEKQELHSVIKKWEMICCSLDTQVWRLSEGNRRKFWNEVELPVFIEDLLCAYVKEMDTDAGIVTDKLKDGAVAISYYDLSDWILCFNSEEKAVAFADKNYVEPSEFLFLRDNAWYCC